MPIEIEKKYRLPEEKIVDVISALTGHGSEFLGEDEEENTIYAGPALVEKGAVLRVRKTRDRATLTYKRRLDGGGDIKHQVEEETDVSDPAAIQRIILELGLRPVLVYEKRRKTWRTGEAEVMVDVLPFGNYVEIEGTVDAIHEAEALLGIADLETEEETYPRITARLGRPEGEVIAARFERE